MDDEHGSAIAPVPQEDGMLSCVWESRREQDECARPDVSATLSVVSFDGPDGRPGCNEGTKNIRS